MCKDFRESPFQEWYICFKPRKCPSQNCRINLISFLRILDQKDFYSNGEFGICVLWIHPHCVLVLLLLMGKQKTHTFPFSYDKSDESVVFFFLGVIKYTLHLHKHVLQECWPEQLIYLHVISVLRECFFSNWEFWKAGQTSEICILSISSLYWLFFSWLSQFLQKIIEHFRLWRGKCTYLFSWKTALSLGFTIIIMEFYGKNVLSLPLS